MQTGEVIIYQSPDGQTSIDVKLENETVWLIQTQMQHLFNQTHAEYQFTYKKCFQRRRIR
jgi:hypothetical protein